jgi:hypothetical protein
LIAHTQIGRQGRLYMVLTKDIDPADHQGDWFETVVVACEGESESEGEGEPVLCRRYGTQHEALAGHAAVVTSFQPTP